MASTNNAPLARSPADSDLQADRDYKISHRFFASLIGVIAIGLPIFIIVVSLVRGCFYNSISHTYYAPFVGDFFVVSLAMIGVFLFAYRGRCASDDVLAALAGVAALGVAVFPTVNSGLEDQVCRGRAFFENAGAGEASKPFFELFPNVQFLHYGSALGLFCFLAYYALVIFTRERHGQRDPDTGKLTDIKLLRNKLYRRSGAVILAVIAALGAYFVLGEDWAFWNRWDLTFWLEAIALIAFGVSWVVHGRVFGRRFIDRARTD